MQSNHWQNRLRKTVYREVGGEIDNLYQIEHVEYRPKPQPRNRQKTTFSYCGKCGRNCACPRLSLEHTKCTNKPRNRVGMRILFGANKKNIGHFKDAVVAVHQNIAPIHSDEVITIASPSANDSQPNNLQPVELASSTAKRIGYIARIRAGMRMQYGADMQNRPLK